MFSRLWSFSRSSGKNTSDSSAQQQLLSEPIESPEVMDQLWSYFTASGNTRAVYRIISVLDWDDIVRERLQTWLATASNYRDYSEMFIRCTFPINYEQRLVDGPLDLDLHVALLARNGDLKFNELPFPLSSTELLRLALKSAAVWSLRSFAKQNEVVARICNQESKKAGGAARQLLANAGSSLSKD